jgi:hypothetical protein
METVLLQYDSYNFSRAYNLKSNGNLHIKEVLTHVWLFSLIEMECFFCDQMYCL